MNKLSKDYKMEDIIKKLEFNEKELEAVKELLNKNKNAGKFRFKNQKFYMNIKWYIHIFKSCYF